MLGELIYESKGKIMGQRVLDTEGPKIETSFSASGTYKGNEVVEIATYWNIAKSPGLLYGEGHGILMINGGTESATWQGAGTGKITSAGKISFRGAIYFFTNSLERFASLNGAVGVYEFETHEDGSITAKVWEWK
jgi:hypothetical protein